MKEDELSAVLVAVRVLLLLKVALSKDHWILRGCQREDDGHDHYLHQTMKTYAVVVLKEEQLLVAPEVVVATYTTTSGDGNAEGPLDSKMRSDGGGVNDEVTHER